MHLSHLVGPAFPSPRVFTLCPSPRSPCWRADGGVHIRTHFTEKPVPHPCHQEGASPPRWTGLPAARCCRCPSQPHRDSFQGGGGLAKGSCCSPLPVKLQHEASDGHSPGHLKRHPPNEVHLLAGVRVERGVVQLLGVEQLFLAGSWGHQASPAGRRKSIIPGVRQLTIPYLAALHSCHSPAFRVPPPSWPRRARLC